MSEPADALSKRGRLVSAASVDGLRARETAMGYGAMWRGRADRQEAQDLKVEGRRAGVPNAFLVAALVCYRTALGTMQTVTTAM